MIWREPHSTTITSLPAVSTASRLAVRQNRALTAGELSAITCASRRLGKSQNRIDWSRETDTTSYASSPRGTPTCPVRSIPAASTASVCPPSPAGCAPAARKPVSPARRRKPGLDSRGSEPR